MAEKQETGNRTLLVIGSSNVDFIMKAPHLPRKGESVANCEFMQAFGGKGANQAVAAARAGGKVAFLCAVGDDAFGPEMIRNFRNDGIDTSIIMTVKGSPTGSALIMIDPAGENYLTAAPGANHSLTPEDIKKSRERIQSAAMVVMQMEVPSATIEAALSLASDAEVPVLINYAPVGNAEVPLSPAMTWLVVNETEASILSEIENVDKGNAKEVCRKLREKGPTHVVLTLGKEGAIYSGPDLELHVPAFKVFPVDTTAAGDTFCGALAVALADRRPIEESLRFASAAAALCVCKMGAQPSIPEKPKIDEQMGVYGKEESQLR